MAPRQALPPCLQGRAFTLSEAIASGVTRRMLQGKRFVTIHRGVHIEAGVELTLEVLVQADLLALPDDACVSHTTALRWYGVNVGPANTRHYSTNTACQTRLRHVTLHRRRGTISPRMVRGVPVLGADRTLVDCGTVLNPVDLVRAGDALVRLGFTTPAILRRYADERHLDGVVRTRGSAVHVRSRVDSVKETDVRLLCVFSGLPEPEANVVILDEQDRFLARGDLVYRALRIVLEYDGWHHERSAQQRQKDILRRERLEEAGWRIIVITAEDLRRPTTVVARVWQAMVTAGYRGPAPIHDAKRLQSLRDS